MTTPLRLPGRDLVCGAGVTCAAPPGARSGTGQEPTQPRAAPGTPDAVLQQLQDGNERFASGRLEHPGRTPADFAALAEGQNPLAVILGCADSRVPPEVLFDQGVGDLFVVRVAGNVVTGTEAVVKGSIEFAVAELNVPLVLVLGHSNCGAVRAAVKHVEDEDDLPGALNDLVSLIRPAVERVHGQSGDKIDLAVRANVMIGVEYLRAREPILAESVRAGRVKVVGATYDLRSGRVEVLG